MIRGHSESNLINYLEIMNDPDYKPDKVLKVYYLIIVSSNEICSACTNVIPKINQQLMLKLNLPENTLSIKIKLNIYLKIIIF